MRQYKAKKAFKEKHTTVAFFPSSNFPIGPPGGGKRITTLSPSPAWTNRSGYFRLEGSFTSCSDSHVFEWFLRSSAGLQHSADGFSKFDQLVGILRERAGQNRCIYLQKKKRSQGYSGSVNKLCMCEVADKNTCCCHLNGITLCYYIV